MTLFAGGVRTKPVVTFLLEMRKGRGREVESVVSVALKLCPDEARKGLGCVCLRLCFLTCLWILTRLLLRTAMTLQVISKVPRDHPGNPGTMSVHTGPSVAEGKVCHLRM